MRTKSKIACFAAPSFHDGSTPPGACANAATGSVADKIGSVARVESRTRRLIREKCLIGAMLVSLEYARSRAPIAGRPQASHHARVRPLLAHVTPGFGRP